MRFPNLKLLGIFKSFALPIHGRDPNVPNPLTDIHNGIIDRALHQFLTPEEADKVINGYRRSPWNEEALNRDIDTLDSDYHEVPDDEHYQKALQKVYQIVKPEVPIKPVHFADLRRYKWRLSTNIGAPFAQSKWWQNYVKAKFNYFSKGIPFPSIAKRDLFVEAHLTSQPLEIRDTRMTKHNLYTEAFFITRKNIHIIKNGGKTTDSGHDLRYWNTAFARQHLVEQDEPDKVRLVFGAPFTLLTAELMFIWPFMVHLLYLGTLSPLLWGFETLLGGWYRLRNWFAKVMPQYGTVVTIDWSKFDKYARHKVIRDIHSKIMRPCFDFTGYHPTVDYPSYPLLNEDGIPISDTLENLWNWMTDAVLTIPLLLPDGRLYRFQHSGIFSGYFQTQILDSLYNLVMIFTILSRMGFDLDRIAIKVQGDDSIFTLLQMYIAIVSSFMYLFAHYATIYFGAVLNPKKSEIRKDLDHAEVLKYKNWNGIPYRDELSLLAQLRHPERSSTPEALAARCVGIAYATCGQLPRTYAICEDIFNYLTKVRGVIPRQSELDFMFRYIDSPDTISFRADVFPSYVETLSHLMDNQRPVDAKHWPVNYFIGLPGRR